MGFAMSKPKLRADLEADLQRYECLSVETETLNIVFICL